MASIPIPAHLSRPVMTALAALGLALGCGATRPAPAETSRSARASLPQRAHASSTPSSTPSAAAPVAHGDAREDVAHDTAATTARSSARTSAWSRATSPDRDGQQLFALDDAEGLALAVLAGGDLLVMGRVGGPDPLSVFESEGPVTFVARVAADGTIAWVQRLRTRWSECLGRGGLALFASDPRGSAFVAALSNTGIAAVGTGPFATSAVATPLLVALTPGGDVAWTYAFAHAGAGSMMDATPLALLADGDGGAFVAIEHMRGGALVHVDGAGHEIFWRELSSAPVPARRCPANGPRPLLEPHHLLRARDGSLLIGGYTNVALDLGGHPWSPPRSEPTPFWAGIDPMTGATRWITRAGTLPTQAVIDTRDHVLGLFDATDTRTLRAFDPRGGTEGRTLLTAAPGRAQPVLLTQAAGTTYVATVRVEGTARGDTSRDAVSLVGEWDERGGLRRARELRGIAAAGATDGRVSVQALAILPGGGVALTGAFEGRLETAGLAVDYQRPMHRCHPGPVGHERALPPGCLEPRDAPALFLARLGPGAPAS